MTGLNTTLKRPGCRLVLACLACPALESFAEVSDA